MKTNVHIDGFNLYHGLFKHQRNSCTPRDKWLDIRSLAEHLIPEDAKLHQVHFFTANLYRSKRNPDQNLRQDLYLRALASIPSVFIHRGKHIPVKRTGFASRPTSKQLHMESNDLIQIETFEEKGSDVNLAVHLLDDAWSKSVECAVIISNDSDFISALNSARRHVRVEVVSPQTTLSKQLRKSCDSWRILDPSILPDCRISNPRVLTDGTRLMMPRSWDRDTWNQDDG